MTSVNISLSSIKSATSLRRRGFSFVAVGSAIGLFRQSENKLLNDFRD